MRASEFESRLRELTRAFANQRDNQGCYDCVRCERCVSSTFCRDSQRLVRCHYCVQCADCTDSAHARGCRSCISVQHCVASEQCMQSAYLVRCVSLTGCSYCFGCVGLTNKDYHILNEPYDRRSYYEITARLTRELGLGE